MRSDLPNVVPVGKRSKLLALADGRDASRAALLAASEALDADSIPLARLRPRESRLEAAARDASTHHERAGAADALSQLREDMAPLLATMERRKAAKAVREREYAEFDFLANIEAALSEHKIARQHSGARPFKAIEPPEIGKVKDFIAAVAETRIKIAAKDAEAERVGLAPLPISDQLAGVVVDIDRRAERGAPDYDARRRNKPAIDMERGFNHPNATADFIVWLHQDTIKARFREIIGTTDAPGALSNIQQQRRLAQLGAEKLELERREEALIVAAEAIGQRIARRRNCDPIAVLEIE